MSPNTKRELWEQDPNICHTEECQRARLAAGIEYYGLDPVGARIWQLIVEGKNLGEVCGVMLEEYEVEQLQIEKDVVELAAELEAKKLVRQAAPDCHTTD